MSEAYGKADGLTLGSSLGVLLGTKLGADDGVVLGWPLEAELGTGKTIGSPPTPLKPYMKVFGAPSLSQLRADV